jgi:hypothetical protein
MGRRPRLSGGARERALDRCRLVRDRADDQIDRIVGERQVVQVGFVELAVGDLLAGDAEHLGRCVDGNHLVAERREVRGVAARPAGGVESDATRELSRISRTSGCSRSMS